MYIIGIVTVNFRRYLVQMSQLNLLREMLSSDAFGDEDLKVALAGKSHQAILSLLSRMLRSKQVIKVKRGVYVFGDKLRRQPISKLGLANKIYFPSYVSLESALSYHGLIPEAVYVTTSVCEQRKKKLFKTPFGEFSYDYIPSSPFFMGVDSVSTESSTILMANPVKALFDLLYVYRKTYLKIEDLESDLRIDLEELQKHLFKFSFKDLETLAHSYGRRNIRDFLFLLVRMMG